MEEKGSEMSAAGARRDCAQHLTDNARQALELARYELTTLHGLVAADGMAPAETWAIDTSKAVAAIDDVLSGFSGMNS